MTSEAKPSRQAVEPSSIGLTLTLGIAGLLSGVALVVAHQTTSPIIERNKAEALQAAVYKVVPNSASMQKIVWQDESSTWTPAEANDKSEGVYAAYDGEGTLVGYGIVGEGAGFQDTIRLLLGYDATKQRIVGMEVLESRETPGLGDKIYKDPKFGKNFLDLATKPEVVLVRDGRKEPNQVDAITGATISSTAVVKIVNSTCRRWLDRLADDSARVPLARPETPAAGK